MRPRTVTPPHAPGAESGSRGGGRIIVTSSSRTTTVPSSRLAQCPSSPVGSGGGADDESSPTPRRMRPPPPPRPDPHGSSLPVLVPRRSILFPIRRFVLRGGGMRVSNLLAVAFVVQIASIPFLLRAAKRRQRQHDAVMSIDLLEGEVRPPRLGDGHVVVGDDVESTVMMGNGGGGTLPFGFVMSELVDRVIPGDAPFDDQEGRVVQRRRKAGRVVLAAFPHAADSTNEGARGTASATKTTTGIGIGGSSVAWNVLRLAGERGYDAHALSTTTKAYDGDGPPRTLGEWWDEIRATHAGRRGTTTAEDEDVLLAVLDPVERQLDHHHDDGGGDDDDGNVLDDGGGDDDRFDIDSLVLSSPGFFADVTIRYLVLGVRSRTDLVTTTTTRSAPNGTIVRTDSLTAVPSFEGIDAAVTLLSNLYRVQVLAISDYCKLDHEDDDVHQDKCYGPNHPLKDEKEVRDFLEWGWHAARRSAAAASAAAESAVAETEPQSPPRPPEFRAYLFATRSLDLAIPSRREFIDESGPASYSLWQQIGKHGAYAVPYKKCPERHDRVRLEFRRRLPAEISDEMELRRREDARVIPGSRTASSDTLARRRRKRRLMQSFRVYCDKTDVTRVIREKIKTMSYDEDDDEIIEVWVDALADGDGEDDYDDFEGDITSVTEAACVRIHCEAFVKKGAPWNGDPRRDMSKNVDDGTAQVACVKRVVRRSDGDGGQWHDAPPSILSVGGRRQAERQPPSAAKKTSPPRPRRPNLLLIEIGPMSRAQFARSLNETRFVLEEELRSFARFDRHTSLFDGGIHPNLSALYSGSVVDLSHDVGDGEDVTTTGGRGGGGETSFLPLWERLRRDGYVTMAAEDVCPENSPTRSLGVGGLNATATDHGSSVTRMLCFDFDRPNCAGKELAARHVLRYTEHFMRTYGGVGAVRSGGVGRNAKVPVNTKRPWAAFLSLVEGDEDSETMGSVVDAPLAGFLRKNFATKQKVSSSASLGVDTVVVVTSQGGLCRGTYYQSPSGKRECHEPILYVSLGSYIGKSEASSFSLRSNLLLRGNAEKKMWTTPLDVHETILHAVLGIKPVTGGGGGGKGGDDVVVRVREDFVGSSLIAVLPKTRKDCRTVPSIARGYCDLVERFDAAHDGGQSPSDSDGDGTAAVDGNDRKEVVAVSNSPIVTCTVSPPPPSILSFFADIPRNRRTMTPPCKGGEDDIVTSTIPKFQATAASCRCATSHRDWFPCKSHPWDFVVGSGRGGDDDIHDVVAASAPAPFHRETFAMVDCKGEDLKIETRILRRQSLVDRFHDKASSSPRRPPTPREGLDPQKLQRQWQHPPNILFLEIDSVSIAYADRHFPKTRALLRRYRPEKKEATGRGGTGTGTDTIDICPLGLCALEYTNVALVGPNSIANQLGALSGCMATLFHKTCFDHDEYFSNDQCARRGHFTGAFTRNCIKCPPGQRLTDPTRRCESMQRAPEVCCSSGGPPSRKPNHICSDVDALEYGLQLYQRGPRSLTTWCPPRPEGVDAGTGRSGGSPWMFDVARERGYVTFFGEEFCYEGSPYVTQDNVMPTVADYHLHKLFCRLAVREAEILGRETKPDELWMIPVHEGLCVDGESGVNKRKLAFEQISQIWEVYPDVPKFAFLNAIAAHDYGTDWSLMTLGAESYDDHLSTFLESMLSREDAHNNVIVIRSDHGLQGGNAIIDHSTQVEHQRPWTEIVVPHDFPGVSHEAMVDNQHALVSSYDIYRTLRSLVSPELRESSEERPQASTSPPIPEWSYDLLSSRVPGDRTCREARVSPEFCPCDFQRREASAGRLGICNQYEPYQVGFCSPQYDPALAKKTRE